MGITFFKLNDKDFTFLAGGYGRKSAARVARVSE
jgi:hypothetical protein